jgi:hypothetical protein
VVDDAEAAAACNDIDGQTGANVESSIKLMARIDSESKH